MSSFILINSTQLHLVAVRWVVGWLVGWSVTLCSSVLEQARDKFNTVLERGQIGHEDPAIKNPTFSSQESGMSIMSPKGHIWMTRSIIVNL